MLAEESLDRPAGGAWVKRVLIALAAVALIGALAWWLHGLINAGGRAPARQVAKLTLLPDTPPPPPPPPPKEEPKPKPVEANRPQPVEQARQPEAPPRAEPLKMEGAAGDAPSAFAAGSVSKDYVKGDPAVIAASGGGGSAADRAQERFYANSARQLLRDEIERQLKGDATQLTAVFSLWVAQDGTIQRFELTPSGRDAADAELRTALEQTRQALKLPPPPPVQQPMRFRLTLRPVG